MLVTNFKILAFKGFNLKKTFYFLICIFFKNFLFSQNIVPFFLSSYSMPFFNAYVSHTEGKALGIHEGYTTFGLLGTSTSDQFPISPIFDIKNHYFNDGKVAFNVGAGIRYNSSLKRIFGFSLYYDFYSVHHFYNQLGPSLEILGDDFDIRINGYFPFGKKSSSTEPKEYLYPGGWFAIRRKHERALSGFDAEIGTQIKNWTNYFYLEGYIAIGPYFYFKKNKNIIGGRTRLNMNLTKYIQAEIDFYKGSHSENSTQLILILNIPLFNQNNCFSFQRVQRQEIIVREKHCCWKTNF